MIRPLQFLLDTPDNLDTVAGVFPASDRSQDPKRLVNRSHFQTLDEAQRVAAAASRLGALGHERGVIDVYLAIDEGPSHSPRYDVVRAPRVGDPVSMRFNGDTYPDGTIVRVSASYRRITTQNTVYARVGQSGSWVHRGKLYVGQEAPWFLVEGHVRTTHWEM